MAPLSRSNKRILTRRSSRLKQLSLVIIAALCLTMGQGVAGASETEIGHPWDGSQVTPIHHIPITDADGNRIVPHIEYPNPFSYQQTCGVCHSYEKISHGTHFNSVADPEDFGRPGQPWVYVDEHLGIQLPLSYRNLPNTFNPDKIGLSRWDFVLNFASHLPGGDMGEPENAYAGRWPVAGPLEANCLACHNGGDRQDLSEWAKQIKRENFRWAATAASGIGEVRGMASRLPDWWNFLTPFNPDDSIYAVPPQVKYDMTNFSSKSFAFFDIEGSPTDDRCLQCHSTLIVGKEREEVDPDIHTVSGMNCVNCHRNGLDHKITRGYETEHVDRDDPSIAEFSCKGCHLGSGDVTDMSGRGGRLGAPVPKHETVPIIHLDSLTCTACHSGHAANKDLATVRTAIANRLGIAGRAIWALETPQIIEPVFIRGDDGKIGPHRMMWPAYWASVTSDTVTPVLPETVTTVGEGILDVEKQVGQAIEWLKKGENAQASEQLGDYEMPEPVIVTADKIYRVDVDGRLDAEDNTSTMPVEGWAWGRDFGTHIEPLVPSIDMDSMEAMSSPGYNYIVNMLNGLRNIDGAPGEPALTSGTSIFLNVFTGEEDYPTSPAYWGYQCVYFGDALEEAVEKPSFIWLVDGGASLVEFASDYAVENALATADSPQPVTEAQVVKMLETLPSALADESAETTATPAYVANGLLWTVDAEGKLAGKPHTAAEPVSWPLAHNVRGVGQSMGALRCEDCHAKDAPFYYAELTPNGPLQAAMAPTLTMKDFHKDDYKPYQTISNFFKWLIIITMSLLILHIIADALRRTVCKPREN